MRPISVALVAGGMLCLLAMGVFWMGGYTWSIPWEVTTHVDPWEFGFRSFQKGPFQVGLTGTLFTLAESYSAGSITRNLPVDLCLVGGIWLGVCVLFTSFTYLPRFWFFASQGLVIFFLISLHLGEVGFLSFGPSWFSGAALIVAYVLPAWLLQMRGWLERFLLRLLVFMGISFVLFAIGGASGVELADQVVLGGYFGFVIVLLFYLFLISEELLFGMLYLITRVRGGQGNHLHFIFLSTIYLAFIGLYYAWKAGFIGWEFSFFDPLALLMVSATLAFFVAGRKSGMYQAWFEAQHYIALLSGLAIVTFGFLALALFRGNDPILDGAGKFISYAHLGFGVFFFFYVILNFIDPLAQGLQVYKIVFKDQPFPYVTTRLAGGVAVLACFLYADRQPYFVLKAGQYNYMGQQAEGQEKPELAQRFYQEANTFGHDNHFAAYQMAMSYLGQGKLKEANRWLGRAILRSPSPQAYINLSGTFGALGEAAASQAILESGLREFPKSPQLVNNLSLLYYELGARAKAEALVAQKPKDESWNDASLVNKWKMTATAELAELKTDFEQGTLAVKANVVAAAIRLGLNGDFQADTLGASYPLHRQVYLINQAWYRPSTGILDELKQELEKPMDITVRQAASQAYVKASVSAGYINRALHELRQEEFAASPDQRGIIYSEMGKIALEQHALGLAHTYFDQAWKSGEPSAQMNLVATLLEGREFDEALKMMQIFGQEDTAFLDMHTDISQVLSGNNLSEEQAIIHLYYLPTTYTTEDLAMRLAHQPEGVIKSLWKKLSTELLSADQHEPLKGLLPIFKEHLPSSDFEDTEMILEAKENGQLLEVGAYAQIASLPDSAKAARLFELASQNAWDENKLLALSRLLEPLSPTLNYNLLVHAIDLNPSVAMLKAYCHQAISSGYTDYGQTALNRLKSLTSEKDYRDFEHAMAELRSKLETDTWGSIL